MISDALSIVSWRSRPRSFVALMSLYESNYLRLAALAGDLRHLPDARVSRVADDCDLRLSVTERSPYTTSLDLTYLFGPPEGDGKAVATYPDMRVRIYHDARLVEAQEWASQHDHQALKALRGQAERELDQRWARNTMLNKWLEYCIDRGHGFRS
jgi:uncharacterized protein YqiB (DUF1249 family)